MTKFKSIVFLSLFTAATGSLFANPVSELTAKQVAEEFFIQKTGLRNIVALEKITTQHIVSAETTDLFYVFTASGSNGFVIVAAEDAIKPILAYSTNQAFSTDNMSPEVRYWLGNYNRQIKHVIDQDIQASPEISGQWEALLQTTNGGNAAKPTTVVAPLLTTTWDQGNYYNSLCPGSGSQSTPSGCVATAMAQIMKYWNAPVEGIGSYSYTHPVYGTQSADFGATAYQWAVMPNDLNSSSSAASKEAVAILMYHCGVAVKMDYSPQGSGAQVIGWGSYPSALKAFKTYFNYKPTTSGVYREDYTDADWIALLKTEMDEARPVLYAGFDLNFGAGHAFVFDGYDEDDLFHINWGWSGYYNGYFSVDDLAPSGTGTGGGSGSYNDGQQAIINIEPINPNELTDFVSLVSTEDLTISESTIEQGDPFSVTATFANIGTLDYTDGFLQARIFNADTDEELGFFNRLYHQNIFSGQDTSITFNTEGIASLDPGNYYIRVQYRNLNELWLNIEDSADMENSVSLTVIEKTLGIEALTDAAAINIYPNPATTTYLTVEAGMLQGDVQHIECFDLQGKQITTTIKKDNKGHALVQVDHLAEGIYLLRFTTDQGLLHKKFVVKH